MPNKPVLVLLHAFPFDGRYWDFVRPLLEPHARVLTPDLRGFGRAPAPDKPWSIEDLADDVRGLLDAETVNRAIVGGLSMGGYVALAFAARHPQRLAKLILADTKAGPDSAEARTARGEAITLIEQQGVGAYMDKQLPKLLSPLAGDAERAAVRSLGAGQSPSAVIAGLRALRDRPDRTPGLASIGCPTLVVVGTDDAITPPAEAMAMTAAIEDARMVKLPGAGHLANIEQPDAFAQAVIDFVR